MKPTEHQEHSLHGSDYGQDDVSQPTHSRNKLKDVGHSKTTPASSAFPEGGTQAWLVVVGCFCVMFYTFGYLNAFGVYEAYYLRTILVNETPSNIAWIGSIQVFFQFAAGIASGPITDRSGPRVIVIACSTLYVLSIMLTSLCTKYWQFLLCQGFFGGIMNGLIYTPAISVISHYFQRRRVLVMSIVSSGSSLGGVIFPLLMDRLLYHTTLGFSWSVRIVGFLILLLAIIASLTIKPRIAPRAGPLFMPSAFADPAYSLQVTGVTLVLIGLMTPLFFLPTYAYHQGIGQDLSFYTLSVLNAVSLFSRIGSGLAAKSLGPLNLLIFWSVVGSILVFSWIRVHSTAAIFVSAALYGLPSGAIVSLMPAALAMVASETSMIGTYIGMALGVYSVAVLIGAPVTGALITHYGSYDPAWILSGAVYMAGAVFLLCARSAFAKGKSTIWV